MKNKKVHISDDPIFACIGCDEVVCFKLASGFDAPLAIYFYGPPYTDPADPIIVATYAMFAAESLGLGTCMLGAIHPLIQNGKKVRKFREDQGILYPSREGLFVIFGFPEVKYTKGIRRTFASVNGY